MTLTAAIVVCLALLVVLSVSIGASLDTEAQRREWRRVAQERRRLRQLERRTAYRLCDRCPYRTSSPDHGGHL